MPSQAIVLGLDLRGGLHLVFEVEWDKAVDVTTVRTARRLKEAFGSKGIKAEVKHDGVKFTIITAAADEVKSVIDEEFPLLESVFSTGGDVVFRLSADDVKLIKTNSVDQAIETIRNRIDEFGVAEPTIHRQGENEIVI